MALLRLLNRSAFICNICFLFAIGILWFERPKNADPGFGALIIVMGFFLSVVLNFIVNISLIVLKIFNKSISEIPRWLIYANGIFLAVQVIYLIL